MGGTPPEEIPASARKANNCLRAGRPGLQIADKIPYLLVSRGRLSAKITRKEGVPSPLRRRAWSGCSPISLDEVYAEARNLAEKNREHKKPFPVVQISLQWHGQVPIFGQASAAIAASSWA